MKLTTGILAVGMMTGGLWAQNPNIINKVQGTMNAVQQTKTNDSNAALGITSTPSAKPAAKPAAGAAAKPAGNSVGGRAGEERSCSGDCSCKTAHGRCSQANCEAAAGNRGQRDRTEASRQNRDFSGHEDFGGCQNG